MAWRLREQSFSLVSVAPLLRQPQSQTTTLGGLVNIRSLRKSITHSESIHDTAVVRSARSLEATSNRWLCARQPVRSQEIALSGLKIEG